MANLMDIYYKVGKDLFEHDFDHQSTEQKKKLVDASLMVYLTGKIVEEDISKAPLLSNDPTTSVDDLAIMLGDIIPKEEHFDTMRHLTHFILNIAGEMQGWSITWYEEKDIAYVDNPLLSFNEEGKIDSLTSHQETSYVQTFQFVHDVFTNSFMNGKTQNKQLTLKDTRTESNK